MKEGDPQKQVGFFDRCFKLVCKKLQDFVFWSHDEIT